MTGSLCSLASILNLNVSWPRPPRPTRENGIRSFVPRRKASTAANVIGADTKRSRSGACFGWRYGPQPGSAVSGTATG